MLSFKEELKRRFLYTYNKDLANHLREKGFQYITTGISISESKAQFWQYDKTVMLDAAINKFYANNPTNKKDDEN